MSQDRVTETRSLVIIGAGNYGPVIAELAESCGFHVVGHLDDRVALHGTQVSGRPVLDQISAGLDRLGHDTAVAVAIGANVVRLKYLNEARQKGFATPALVSPQAVVSPSAKVQDAVYLHSGSHVWTEVCLGLGVILSPHSTVAHHSHLGDGCFVSSGANVGASILIGQAAFFGMGSVVSTGVGSIAEHTFVGAGSVVIRDTEARGVYVGSPARLLRFLPRV